MKAVTFEGPGAVAVKDVEDPVLKDERDAVIRVTASAICGSDLHLYTGRLPMPLRGWVLGHEYVGVVEDVGSGVSGLAKGDRVVGSFMAACGECFYCERDWPTQCLRQQHLGFGQVPGAQAEYLRVPFADTTLFKTPDSLSDESLVCVGDVLATGYFAAEQAGIQPGDVVVVVGCGAVGLYSIMCAQLFQPAAVIALDSLPDRLALAQSLGAVPLSTGEGNPGSAIRQLSGGRGADVVIEAVGQEDSIRACFSYVRPAGTISVVGVYSEAQFAFPMFVSFLRNIRFLIGLCPATRYMPELLRLIEGGKLDPARIITHDMPLAEAPRAYDIFANRTENCTKVILRP